MKHIFHRPSHRRLVVKFYNLKIIDCGDYYLYIFYVLYIENATEKYVLVEKTFKNISTQLNGTQQFIKEMVKNYRNKNYSKNNPRTIRKYNHKKFKKPKKCIQK